MNGIVAVIFENIQTVDRTPFIATYSKCTARVAITDIFARDTHTRTPNSDDLKSGGRRKSRPLDASLDPEPTHIAKVSDNELPLLLYSRCQCIESHYNVRDHATLPWLIGPFLMRNLMKSHKHIPDYTRLGCRSPIYRHSSHI